MAPPIGSFTLESTGFAAEARIPRRYSCEGDGVSPPLRWSDPPADAVAFALVVDDASARGFVHWILVDIAGDTNELAEGVGREGGLAAGVEGRNDFGRIGWAGPCPPPGRGDHRYVFPLYALSDRLGSARGVTEHEVLAAAGSRTFGTAVLEGAFGR